MLAQIQASPLVLMPSPALEAPMPIERFVVPRRGNDAYRAQQWSLAKECYDLAIAADSLRMDVEHLESQEPIP